MQALHALSSLAKSGLEILERENFINLALKSISLHKSSCDFASAAWHTLGTIANAGYNFSSSKSILLGEIFNSMKIFDNNDSLQITAAYALAHMVFNNNQEDYPIIHEMNGMECLLNAMKKFPQNQSLQASVLFAIGAIVPKCEGYQSAILNNDGVSIIIESMRRSYDLNSSSLDGRSPEPVLYSNGTAKLNCSKPLLLYLFGSVCLMNLADNGLEIELT